MSQTIAGLVIGTAYQLTWDMESGYHCCGNPASPGVSAAIDGNTWLFTVLNSNYWGTTPMFTETFTYTGTSNTLMFSSQLNSTDQDAGFDNISITPVGSAGVPEPSSFVLVGAGIAAVLLRRRR
jgi:hypothetical protein